MVKNSPCWHGQFLTEIYEKLKNYAKIGPLLLLILFTPFGFTQMAPTRPTPPSGWQEKGGWEPPQDVDETRRTAIVNAVERASPAVVNISTTKEITRFSFWDDWWAQIPYTRKLRGLGSGVIVDQNGYIITNHHVIEDADSIKVILPDGREFEAEVFGYDYLSDLAILTVNATKLPVITWGDSDNLLIGEWAVAIGHPFVGQAKPTVTIGIVSATQRTLNDEERFHEGLIQTDASINPGNSGGALVNIAGQLIGINTAIYTTSGGSQGVGFAIPANKARKVIQQIIDYGSVIPPYIGIETQPVTEDLAEKLFPNADSQTHSVAVKTGVLVSKLEKKSPADTAGIKRGDVITTISGQQIKSETSFKALIRLLPLHKDIQCQFFRNRKKRNTTLTLKTRQWQYTPPGWGLTLEQPDREMVQRIHNDSQRRTTRNYERQAYNQQPGVIVSYVEEQSGLAGALKRGDLIFQIDNNKIHSLEIFKMIDQNVRARRRVRIYFKRNGETESIIVSFNQNNSRR